MSYIEEKIKKYKTLLKKIKIYKDAYYMQNKSLITDYEYDFLIQEVRTLELQYSELKLKYSSPLLKIGHDLFNAASRTTKHIKKMYSLNHVSSIKKLQIWFNNIETYVKKNICKESIQWICEPKIDGLAINLIYRNGILKYASTRGDGEKGENIIANVLTIPTIPKYLNKPKKDIKIPSVLEIRGEVFVSPKDFNLFNKKLKKKCLPLFSNLRNFASGSIRHKDPKITSKRKLKMLVHGIGEYKGSDKLINQSTAYHLFKIWGLPVTPFCRKIFSLHKIDKLIKFYKSKKVTNLHHIDGIVLKIDSLKIQNLLGHTLTYPKWAIAYKFSSKFTKTKIIDIIFEIGRTGKITPLAKLKSVHLSGTNIEKATLHNLKFIYKKDIRIGDTVVIHKSGNIIPEILKSIKEIRNKNIKRIKKLDKCPSCDKHLDYEKIEIRCLNHRLCFSQMRARLLYIGSRNILNISSLGKHAIKILTNKKYPLIRNESNIFDITLPKIRNQYIVNLLEVSKNNKAYFKNIISFFLKNDKNVKINDSLILSKRITNLITELEYSKKQNLWRLISALCIRYLGPRNAQILLSKFNSIDTIQLAKMEELLSIEGFGLKIASSIFYWFKDSWNINLIKKWKNAGVKFSK